MPLPDPYPVFDDGHEPDEQPAAVQGSAWPEFSNPLPVAFNG